VTNPDARSCTDTDSQNGLESRIAAVAGRFVVIAGCSDATLNRGGVRLGTAEFYRFVEGFPQVADSLVVHLEDPAGGNGELLDGTLRRTITTTVRTALSPRHIPDTITAVPAIPRNRTGKKLELPVKKILLPYVQHATARAAT
jgi:acetoacetyl-CoA synthetase